MSKSYKNQSISDISLSLARRQVALRHGFEESTVKQAGAPAVAGALGGLAGATIGVDGLKNLQEGVKTWWNNRDPVAQKALIGAGIGGVAGAGSSLLRKNRRKHFLRDAFTGALGGGAVLGGIGAVQDYKRLTDKLVDVKPPAGETGGNRSSDDDIVKRVQQFEENKEPDPADKLITEIGNIARIAAEKFDPIGLAETALKQIPGGQEIAPAVGVGYGATGATAILNDLIGSRTGIQNLTNVQFNRLQEVAMKQLDSGPWKNIEDTPIGQALKKVTGSDEAVGKLLTGDKSLMQGVNVQGTNPISGFGGRSGANNKFTSWPEMLKATGNQSFTPEVNPNQTLFQKWFSQGPKTIHAKVPQGALEQLVQKSVDKPGYVFGPGARALSGASQGLSKVPRPRIPKTRLGYVTWALSLAAAALGYQNRQKALATKAENQQLVNPQSAP